MNRSLAGFQLGAKAVNNQDTVTKLDFLKIRLVIKVLVLGVFVVGLALFYTWSRIQIVQIGYEINEQRHEQQLLSDENRVLKLEYSLLRSPQRIREYSARKLHMAQPAWERIIGIR
jgi:cell division protein FtsL